MIIALISTLYKRLEISLVSGERNFVCVMGSLSTYEFQMKRSTVFQVKSLLALSPGNLETLMAAAIHALLHVWINAKNGARG